MRLVVTPTSEASEKLLDEAGSACAAALRGELPLMEPTTALEVIKALSGDARLVEATESALLAANWPVRAPEAAHRARNVLAAAGLNAARAVLLRSEGEEPSTDATLKTLKER